MRTAILILCVFVSFTDLQAQRYTDTFDPKSDEVKSLLGKGNELNGFGGVDLKISDLIGQRGLIVGGYGGVLVNRRYLLALGAYGVATDITFEGLVMDSTKNVSLNGGYGGLMVGGMIASTKVVHISLPVFFGAGSFEIADKDFFPNRPNDAEFAVENSVFFVVEPGIQLEFNITEHFRIASGLSYRYISGLELDNLRDEDITGLAFTISLRAGRF